MADKSELLRVPVFADLPDDQLEWFLSQSQELNYKAGDTYLRQGTPADSMFVILEGQLEVHGDMGGDAISFSLKAGDVTGTLPYSRMTHFNVNGRSVTDSRVLRFPAAMFPDLVQKMPELAKRLVGLMADRIRETTRIEQQRDRLAALGKLSAGLAHELNNPASAAKRATGQLRDILKKIKNASLELGRRDLTAAQRAEIEKLETSFIQRDEPPPDPLTASDLEEQVDSLLRSHGLNDLWQLAADLAKKNIKPEALESLFAALDAGYCPRGSGPDCRLGRDRQSVERDRKQHVANLRSRRCDQGIYAHGPGAGAKCRYCEKPGKYAHHPKPQA